MGRPRSAACWAFEFPGRGAGTVSWIFLHRHEFHESVIEIPQFPGTPTSSKIQKFKRDSDMNNSEIQKFNNWNREQKQVNMLTLSHFGWFWFIVSWFWTIWFKYSKQSGAKHVLNVLHVPNVANSNIVPGQHRISCRRTCLDLPSPAANRKCCRSSRRRHRFGLLELVRGRDCRVSQDSHPGAPQTCIAQCPGWWRLSKVSQLK